MKKLFYYGNLFMSKSDWRDAALMKFCLFSLGLLVGTQIPRKKHKFVMVGASLVFVCTYVPLMAKLFGIILEDINSEVVD